MRAFIIVAFFLIINFVGLAIGNWLMNEDPASELCISLIQALWTPPGWVLSFVWITAMICFYIFLTYLLKDYFSKHLIEVYSFPLFLTVIYNYIFFNQHPNILGLVGIITLAILISYVFRKFQMDYSKTKRLLFLPNIVGFCLIISFNA